LIDVETNNEGDESAMSSKDDRRFSGCTIQITEELRVRKLDDLNWSIEIRRIPKEGKQKGETLWDNESYQPTLGDACRWIARNLTDEKLDIDSLEAYGDQFRRIGEDIKETVNAFVQGGVKP
jgi:hypothetical protein